MTSAFYIIMSITFGLPAISIFLVRKWGKKIASAFEKIGARLEDFLKLLIPDEIF